MRKRQPRFALTTYWYRQKWMQSSLKVRLKTLMISNTTQVFTQAAHQEETAEVEGVLAEVKW